MVEIYNVPDSTVRETASKTLARSTISVIVPVYKVEAFLRPCMDSILAQTFTDFELILVDDGSPDNCGAICDEYAAKDSRVRVIHQENGGLSAARNAGIEAASGEYLTFVDSDDMIHPKMLERMMLVMKETDAELCVCDLLSFTKDAKPDQEEEDSHVYRVLDPVAACNRLYDTDGVKFTVACGKLFAHRLFSSIRFPLGMIHEDEATTYQALYAANRIIELNNRFYFYRSNPNSIMNSAFSSRRFDSLKAFQDRKLFFEAHGETELAEKTALLYRTSHAKLIILANSADKWKEVPKQFQMSVPAALRCLRKEASDQNYTYYLAMIHPKWLRPHAYWRKVKKILHIPCN